MSSYTTRYIANIVIEAQTPLKIGSSTLDMLQDSPVQKDFNDLPMILGTSIAGVLKKEFNSESASDIFGDEKGSRLIISNALLCDENMEVNEKLLVKKSKFLNLFNNLPQREHTSITDKGVAKENSKFDEEVVFKGSTFKFRLEFLASNDDDKIWDTIIQTINSNTFRLGGGTTKGFGDVKVLHDLSSYDVFELTSKEYGESSSSLNNSYAKKLTQKSKATDYTHYILKITPEDFFLFGSGFGDDDADSTPVYESIINYDTHSLSQKMVLLPATSLKGALSHRTTFHYNRLSGNTIEAKNGIENIRDIFGEAKDGDKIPGKKGSLLLSDCFKISDEDTKVFDHVSIDRFTGGAKESALFQEKTIAQRDEWEIEILLKKETDALAVTAFESALKDITTGMLPLGGTTTKGNGVFTGTITKNGENYEV